MTDKLALRRNWRINWLRSIHEFSEDGTQRGSWLSATNTNPHHSFVEYTSCYFDDLGLSEGGYERAVRENLVSQAEADAVADFHAKADSYRPANDYDHEAILSDPKWAEIVSEAKRARAALAALLSDAEERRVLAES